MTKLAVIDTETTGLDPASRLTEIACIVFEVTNGRSNVLDEFETLIHPGMPLPPDTAKVNGITDDMVADAPSLPVALIDFWERIPDDAVLMAHYAPFDVGMVTYNSERVGSRRHEPYLIIDTCAIAKFIGATKRNNLDALVDHYGIQRQGKAHRALCDTDACMQYYTRIAQDITIEQFAMPWFEMGGDYHFIEPTELPSILSAVPDLLATAGAFSFVYEDDKGKRTERALTPYGWYEKGGELYINGLCHLRGQRRTFRADRIVEVI